MQLFLLISMTLYMINELSQRLNTTAMYEVLNLYIQKCILYSFGVNSWKLKENVICITGMPFFLFLPPENVF